MSNAEPLYPGQQVFLRQPVQIYATVLGRPVGDSLLPGDQVRYAVQLLPLHQIYLPEDIELSVQPHSNDLHLDQIAPAPSQDHDRTPDSEGVPKLWPADSADSFQELAQETNNLIARRAYELYSARGYTHGYDQDDWRHAVSEILLHVPADIAETETQLTIYADVPGVSPEDLEVRVGPSSICITGKRQTRSQQIEANRIHTERRNNRIFRIVDLPSEIHPSSATASINSGVLEITLQKVAMRNVVQFPARGAAA